MLKWYGASTLLWGYSFGYICERLQVANLQGVELWAEQFWQEQFVVTDILKEIRSNDLDISLHAASWDLNISSLNEGIRKQSIREIERSIELAYTLHVENITIHPGRLTLNEKWKPWHMDCLQRSLDTLERIAQRAGITLSIELMEYEKKEFVTSPYLLNELVDHRSGYVTTTFDIAHIPLFQSPGELLGELHRVDKIHISDSTAKKFHVPLGEGAIDIMNVMPLIERLDVPIVIEGFDYLGEENSLEKNVQFLQENNLLRKLGMTV
jgi:sugar phosphate isomerase/epimerase